MHHLKDESSHRLYYGFLNVDISCLLYYLYWKINLITEISKKEKMTEVTNEKIMAAILELTNSVNKNTDSMAQLASKIEDIKIQQNEIKRDFLSFKSNTQASLNALEASQQSIKRSQDYLNKYVETMKAELTETNKRAETAEVKVVQLNADLQILSDDLQNERNKYNDLEQYG